MKTASLRQQMKTNNRTAYEAALHLLGYRAQSEREIRTKLKQRGYGPEEIENTIIRLQKAKYLDDEALAEEVFTAYRDSGLYGDRYIQNKLRMRGLKLEWHLTQAEEEEKARQALQHKVRMEPDFLTQYRRAVSFLIRRGFSPSVVSAVLNITEE